MTPVLRNAFTLFGFMLCICDVQLQSAQENIFAGNFLPDQELWLTWLRYGLCGGALILSAVVLSASEEKNLGFRRHGFIFVFLFFFCLITAIRSAMDMRNGLYLLATGSRHIASFALVAMATSLARNFNCVRPLLLGALPAYIFRFIFSTYNFIIGDGVEITGGVRSVALDAGFMIFGIFYLFVGVNKTLKLFAEGKQRAAFGWMVASVILLFLPIASFRRATIVITVGSLILGFLIHSFVNRILLRRILPILAVNVLVAAVSVGMFFATFGPDVAMERIRSFAIHDEGDLSASNASYERDFDYTFDLIKRNPVAGIGFSTAYGISGRDEEMGAMAQFDRVGSEIVLHVGLLELVVRQGIFGILVWLLVFLWIPGFRIYQLRKMGTQVSLIPCLCLAFFFLYANLLTSPPFYNEVRPAIFLGMALGIALCNDPDSLFEAPKLSFGSFKLNRAWVRTQEA
jgi:hypothetical protein